MVEKKDLSLWSERKDGEAVNYLRAYDGSHEIKLVIDEIGKLLSTYNSYNSFAILFDIHLLIYTDNDLDNFLKSPVFR